MRTRRLLLLNYEYPPVGGGASNASFFLARALVQLGHRVTVLTSGLRGQSGTSAESGVTVHRLPVGRSRVDHGTMAEMASYLLWSGARINSLASRERFEASIAFFTLPSGAAARWLQLWRGTPYLVSLRGSDVPGHDRMLDRSHRLTSPLRRQVLRGATAIVANSAGLAATSMASDPFPVQVVPNGVDCDRFQPTATARDDGLFRLLFVGRLHRDKNPHVLIEQLAVLPAELLARCELWMVGNGDLQAELQALAAKRGVAQRIRWLGWQDKEALPAIYRQVDVLVNPSFYEGMPNVVLEAMASGLAIIASDIPGNRSVVQAGLNGLLFALDQPDTLGAALTRLGTNPGLVRTLGAAGRQLAAARYSWTSAAESYLELLAGPTHTPHSYV